VELPAKLYGARIVGGSHLPEVRVSKVRIDIVELRVVEDVEGLESQFQAGTFVAGKWNCFEQGPIEVEEPWSDDYTFSSVAEALIRTAGPGSNGCG